MNRNATLRFRRVTALLALAWVVLALGFAAAHRLSAAPEVVPPLLISGLATHPWRISAVSDEARAAGIAPGDRLLAIDGEVVERALVDRGRIRAGVPNEYRVRQGDRGRVLEVALRPVPAAALVPRSLSLVLLLLPLIGLVYLAVGVTVWRMRPDRIETWALFLFCCVMGAQLLLPAQPGTSPWLAYWLNLPLIGATTFHLFTSYPEEPPWVVRHPLTRSVPYLVAVPIGLLAATEGALRLPLAVGKPAALWFTIGLCFVSILVALRERSHLRETKAADRADVMLLGAVVSFLPAMLALLAANWLPASFPYHLGFAAFFVFPIAVGYGIVRKQLFEIRVVAKSSAAYGAVTLVITGLYAFLITFADAVVTRFNVNARSPWFSVGFLFAAILAFNPLRDRMQSLVDRFFDRDHALYRRALREISEAMVSMLSTKEVVDRILVALTETMGVSRAVVLLEEEGHRQLAPAAARGDWEEESLDFLLALDHPLCRRLLIRRDALARSDFDDERDLEVRELCRDVFDQLEVELIVPIPYGADLIGAIGVGHKYSGERLGAEDRQLLLTLANQSSIAIQNSRAFDEIADLNATLEARVEERTHELHDAQAQLMHSEKMRSLGQLVAGVAHELNNPIGFVHANLQLLQEYSRKLAAAHRAGEDTTKIEAAIEKLLSRSREGTERVTKIVQDLRTFSRMDQADLVDVNLNEEIDRTVTLMEPRLRDGIDLVRDYGELPRVRCYAGQLSQVFMNLLMNACDALEGKGRIRIRTRVIGMLPAPGSSAPSSSGVRLEFHDDGPGIPPEVQAQIFEPFYTTKPVGKGTGLGLSISYGIVERHGGRMLVGSAPGEGTTFVIELPLVAAPSEDETPSRTEPARSGGSRT
ncbi:MAG: GAF domain-containing sensor histidine kinase [Myxococcota bacterium]|nr:GAF domain-containing sensor histidine kinase [Myxococcota bacterium]